MSHFQREITLLPGHKMDRNGHITVDSLRVPTITHKMKNSILCQAIEINGQKLETWKLLQLVWYPKKWVFTRTGDLMDLRSENVFAVEKMEFKTRISDQYHMQAIWYEYQNRRTGMGLLRDKCNITLYDQDDYVGLIKSLVIAGIRP